ncbi:unnamed protein product [Cylicostephanus goldi]|uniref:Uncharacterized protein n=1 Tax=Cylicostephanus goldi TaxID=71465 RepID=A0A3P6TEY0_CYLGO|nr:unnamed protein product [Cylicostephanus goldi]
MWLFASTTCGNILSRIDSYTGSVLLSATIVLDIISVTKLKGNQCYSTSAPYVFEEIFRNFAGFIKIFDNYKNDTAIDTRFD